MYNSTYNYLGRRKNKRTNILHNQAQEVKTQIFLHVQDQEVKILNIFT